MKSFREFLKESNNKESVIEKFEKVFPKEVVEAESCFIWIYYKFNMS